MTRMLLVVGSSLFLAVGCGDDGGGGSNDASNNPADASLNGPDAAQQGIDAMQGGGADASIPAGFTSLIQRAWTVPAGSEIYRCTRVTVQEDTYISTFRSLSPVGTHHTVLSVNTNPSNPDGDYNCSAGDIEHSMLFASGVGTDDLDFPSGVAIKVNAGDQLDLNLHLFNVTDSPITGTSGTLVKTLELAEVQQLAENVFGGQFAIFLQSMPGVQQVVNGGCTFSQDATVITLWPHMHQLGQHMKVVHEKAGGDVTVLDQAFNFEEQRNYPVTPFVVSAGERLDVDCTYVNGTGSTVTFGDSSSQEMCFVGIYRYPATGQGVFDCVETSF